MFTPLQPFASCISIAAVLPSCPALLPCSLPCCSALLPWPAALLYCPVLLPCLDLTLPQPCLLPCMPALLLSTAPFPCCFACSRVLLYEPRHTGHLCDVELQQLFPNLYIHISPKLQHTTRQLCLCFCFQDFWKTYLFSK